MKCAYSSNIGIRRKTNQDAYLAANFEKDGKMKYVFVVADGLGGHPAGEVASQMTVDYIKQYISSVDNFFDYGNINSFVNAINQRIINAGKEDGEKLGMATTLTMGVVSGNRLAIAHVGDSRAYRIFEGGMEQLTKDHSLVQALVDEGRLQSSQVKQHPQKNVITRALGTDLQVKTDLFEYTINPGDCFMICSDGLYNMVPESVIHDIVIHHDLEEAVKEMINLANRNGGLDNITVILFRQDDREIRNQPSEVQV